MNFKSRTASPEQKPTRNTMDLIKALFSAGFSRVTIYGRDVHESAARGPNELSRKPSADNGHES